jgi:autotransporter-associated beta strand protein
MKTSTAHRAALHGCASLATLALFVTPTHAEQQLFNFFVNGAASNDVTNPAFGGAPTFYQTGSFRSYRGPGQGPQDSPVLPGGFQTTSSGPGAISDAAAAHGTKGHAIVGAVASDAYDGYGGIGFRQGGNIVVNFGGLTVNRTVDVTHGPDDAVTPITVKFANAGVANAARWVETISNTTAAPISGSMAYFNNLGSDSNTRWVASSSGNLTSPTGNLWLTSIQQGAPSDPVITHVFGNNAYTTTTAQMLHADGFDRPEWQYPITVAPGETKTLVLFNVLTADLNYGPGTVAADIALGGQLANLITNNGAPIAADSVPFMFFSDMTRDQLMSIINYDFVGLTIDTSRPFFIETDFAVAQSTAIFDGGVLKPTTATIFNQNFIVHAAGGTVDSSNGNLTFNGVFSDVGPLTFTGTNATILTNTNTYTGATNVNGGALVVNGSTASSALTTVNAGGTLAGTGTVGSTQINPSGALAPGAPGSVLTVQGSLTFTAASSYMVEVSGVAADRTNVSGAATLAGTVQVTSPTNSFRFNSPYTILTSSGLGGTQFNALTTPAGTTGSLIYSGNNVQLTLTSALGQLNGLNTNQRAAGAALDAAFNANGNSGGLGGIFAGNVAQNLTQASGETATGSQQTTFDAMNLFMGVMTDPFTAGRGGNAPGATGFADEDVANAYASSGRKRSGAERDAYGMFTKAPPAPPFEARWNVWAAGFGGSQTTDGNATLGSNTATSRIGGVAVGADYWLSPQMVAGFALAGGGTNFSIANGLGTGRSDLFQAGAFVRHTIGSAYLTAAAAYGWQDITTDRTVTIAGIDQLRAQFNANTFSGRVEGGNRYVLPWIGGIGLTPYAAAQAIAFDLPAYAESVLSGANTFALAYAAKTVTATRSELGLRSDKSYAVGDAILTLRGRAAWAHDFNAERSIAATFQTLPGASFVVNGAAPAHDAALTTASAEMKFISGLSLAATFEGEFSDVTRSYAGKGVARYAW